MDKIKTRKELINLYLDFFKQKNHKVIPSASLIPENDPTVLFTTAGMHPLVPYLIGQKHPLGKRLASVQKCIRTGDIDEVGDEVHHTFFEMLGNWSLGDYFKQEAIEMSFEFLTKKLKIPKKEIAVTCFKGDENAPKDTESAKIWKSLGITKIKFLDKKENWWETAGPGPCGPDTEMFVNNVEIWNDVFMQYNKDKNNNYLQLKQKNVDTGMGVERTLAILNNLNDNYQTSVFFPIIQKIEKLSNKKYNKNKEQTRAMRIIADHIKASVFILGDERAITPSNVGQGYVLRRLIRRAIRYAKFLEIPKEKNLSSLVEEIINIYKDTYPELTKNKKQIIEELNKEEDKFEKTLEAGLRKFKQLSKDKKISGKQAFLLFQSFGFPIEMTQELAKEKNMKIDLKEYEKEFQKHQKLSKTSSQGTFKSGLADDSEKTKRLHTATHLLAEALRRVLKNKNIKQKGSNINAERLRFDFNFDRKLTQEEIEEIENLVNEKIKQAIDIKSEEMPLKKAIKSGAQAEFGAKYPEIVSIYTIGNFSKEICTGPHVENTKQIGKFKIIKEESSSAGIRRIKAVVK